MGEKTNLTSILPTESNNPSPFNNNKIEFFYPDGTEINKILALPFSIQMDMVEVSTMRCG
jgi:hypothetical protein